MGKYFVRDTPLAGLEREMMLPPNFAPRGSSSAILCGYSPHGAGVDCQSCIDHRRQSRRTLVCLHITERVQTGAVTIVELAAETVRPWKHPGLKQRAIGLAGRLSGFHFEDQLHVARMLKMTKGEEGVVNSHWLAAVYLLSAHAGLWQKTIAAAERVQNRTALQQGDYYGPGAGADCYASAKRDFAVRSGLIPGDALFSPEQLTEVYRSIHETLDSGYPITDERQKCLVSAESTDGGMKFY